MLDLYVISRCGCPVAPVVLALATQRGLAVQLFVAHIALCCRPQTGFAVRFLEIMSYVYSNLVILEQEVPEQI